MKDQSPKINAQIERLSRHHQALEHQLAGFAQRPWLTPEDEALSREIKKRKLRAKDRIVALSQ
jgi:hypothetical protein